MSEHVDAAADPCAGGHVWDETPDCDDRRCERCGLKELTPAARIRRLDARELAQQKADEWTARFPLGTLVLYRPAFGQPVKTETRSHAWPRLDGTIAVAIDGRTEAVNVSHLEQLPGVVTVDPTPETVARAIVVLTDERTAALARVAVLEAELAPLRARLVDLNGEHDRLHEVRDSALKLARIATKLARIATKLGPSPAELALIRSRAQELLDLAGEP